MRRTILPLAMAALLTAGLASPSLAAEPAAQYPAAAAQAAAAGSDYTYEELLTCLTAAGCTEAEALAYAGEPVKAPEGAAVRYSPLRLERFDGTEQPPVQCLVLAALEYAPGCAEPRSILAVRSPMALTEDGSAAAGQVFAALYSGRNVQCILTGGAPASGESPQWTAAGWIFPGGTGEAFTPGEDQTALYSAQAELFFPSLEK